MEEKPPDEPIKISDIIGWHLLIAVMILAGAVYASSHGDYCQAFTPSEFPTSDATYGPQIGPL